MFNGASLVPLSWSAHGGRMWCRFTSYHFAEQAHWVPLAGEELSLAALAFPLAFHREADSWQVVALLGLEPGHNAWVDEQGRWCQRYVPAALRSPPFGVRPEAPETLCVDENSEWLVAHYDGEPLFDEQRDLARFVQQTHAFLTTWAQGCQRLGQLATVLEQHEVLTPWTSPALDALPTLYQIDETRWNALSDEAALAVRRQGALPLIYAQLLAKANLGTLQARTRQPSATAQAPASPSAQGPRQHAVLESWRDALAEEPGPDEWEWPGR